MKAAAASVILLVAAWPAVAGAQRRAHLAQERGDFDGDGRRDSITLLPGGTITIELGGARRAEKLGGGFAPKAGQIETARGRAYGGTVAVVTGRASRNSDAPGHARVYRLRRGSLETLWSGPIGPQGTDREWGQELRLDDRGLLLYQTRPELRECGGTAAVELYGRRFDFAGQKRFRPYRRQALIPTRSPVLTATTAAPPRAPTPPRAAFVRPVGATSRLGASSARELYPPQEIADGDPATAWVEGRGGTGRGEQIQLRQGEPAEPIEALALIPGHGASADDFARLGRIQRLGLELHGPKGTRSYVIRVPRDPLRGNAGAKERHRRIYWVRLPEPYPASCATVTLLDSYRGRGARGRRDDVAISELHLLTSAELEDQVDPVLARRVAAGGKGSDSAARALSQRGDSAARAVAAALAAAGDDARLRLYEVLLHLRSPETAAPLATAIVDAATPPGLRELLVARLASLGPPGWRELGRVLAAGKASESALLEVVAALRSAPAGDRMDLWRTAAGRGSRAVRKAVAEAAAAEVSTANHLRALMAAARAAPSPAAEADLWRAVGMAGAGSSKGKRPQSFEDGSPAGPVAERLAEVTDYERRYRLVQALGAIRSGGAEALQRWWQGPGAKSDPQTVALRRVAVAATRENTAASALRREALGDSDPGVRAEAARALAAGEHGDRMAQLVQRDPWPVVRVAAAGTLARSCKGAGQERALVSAARGSDDLGVQRAAMAALLSCAPGSAGATLLAIAADPKQDAGARTYAVSELGNRKLRAQIGGLLDLLDRALRNMFENEAEQQVASTALVAAGKLGDARAVPPLLRATRDEAYPTVQAAAAAGLGHLCRSPGPRENIIARLRDLSSSSQRTVVLAARRALRQCER